MMTVVMMIHGNCDDIMVMVMEMSIMMNILCDDDMT